MCLINYLINVNITYQFLTPRRPCSLLHQSCFKVSFSISHCISILTTVTEVLLPTDQPRPMLAVIRPPAFIYARCRCVRVSVRYRKGGGRSLESVTGVCRVGIIRDPMEVSHISKGSAIRVIRSTSINLASYSCR